MDKSTLIKNLNDWLGYLRHALKGTKDNDRTYQDYRKILRAQVERTTNTIAWLKVNNLHESLLQHLASVYEAGVHDGAGNPYC